MRSTNILKKNNQLIHIKTKPISYEPKLFVGRYLVIFFRSFRFDSTRKLSCIDPFQFSGTFQKHLVLYGNKYYEKQDTFLTRWLVCPKLVSK